MNWFEVFFIIGIVCIPAGAIFYVVWRNRGE